ncbi:MAG TPA: hypothetical protein DCE41_13695 [Cytophagales bacterium]|nr:hypothetical protein [Cytophagales bacterium]HAA22716.1 hypothetical protein [Cytophagales bacterium]HAP58672.1 hypothetical protein [Cytophagales bacterium]
MSSSVQGPIRLAHIITRFVYFLLILVWAVLFAIFLAQILFGLPETWSFSIDLPLKLDIAQPGVLSVGSEQYPVEISAVRGKVAMQDPPSFFIWMPALITLFCIVLAIFALWCFKGFMGHMVAGEFFHQRASLRLRQTAGWVVLAWFIQTTFTFWVAVWVQNHVSFNDVTVHTSFSWDLAWLAVALFLWIVSRILDHGRDLEDEQKLTI